ncbi:MAG: MarR family transcriptional regulator [Candidatus Marsarchaeota archaeon]|nr:MarR family transcriptional regulator [Candidatus Marsarchaeota archaeon]
MSWNFGVSEILVLREVVRQEKPSSVKALSIKTRLSDTVVSRALKELSSKGMVFSKRKKTKIISISDAPHAQAFKSLFLTYPYIDFRILSHYNIRVLAGLVFPNASVARVERISLLPKVTVRRLLARLLQNALVGRKGSNDYFITLPELQSAVSEYCAFIARKNDDVPGGLITRGFYGFLRTDSARIPSFMKPTGLSVLNEFGVAVIQTDFKDYYYNVFKKVRKPCIEEAVIHALIRAEHSKNSRENSYALLALHKNLKRVNVVKFLEIAGDLNATQTAGQSLEFVQGFATKPLMHDEISKNLEFRELVKEYE